ncbi:MAG: hypothetical protein KY469_13270 [Actinobacteria bacterium]|nr:hypothetical protein [Actinomycetota bacterium]
MRRPTVRVLAITTALAAMLVVPTLPASATPVCTDGYQGGPPRAVCGGRVFPEAALSRAYVQYTPNAAGFREYQHGAEYLAELYPRWISVFTLRDRYEDDAAVSAGPDRIRANTENDTGDGQDIFVIKITDHTVPDEDKETLLFSLSVHGNERGGLEGGLRTAEDLAMGAEDPLGPHGHISDGEPNYTSTTGREPIFHTYSVREVLKREVVYLVDFNIDGWVVGEVNPTGGGGNRLYARGNSIGTDLNRQMPTIGRISSSRNPLQETEMLFGTRFMHEVAEAGIDGKMAYGADIHGELTSRAYIDIMYPAGQFDSVDHRRLMAIAERTKSVVDETLYLGIQNEIEEATGGNEGGGVEDHGFPVSNAIPTKPAHWATVWDTLGYTDTGFIGDYMATDLGVTGMDYEIFLNHTVPDKVWNVYLQENHINGSRAIIETAMAYALYQQQEFNDNNVVVDPLGRAGYVFNPDVVTDSDEDGAGRLPGPAADGIGADGQPVEQRPYSVTNMRWFEDTSRLMGDRPFVSLSSADVASDPTALDALDTLVLADVPLPEDTEGRSVDEEAYYANIEGWVERGGNLVLTDRALHALASMGVVPAADVDDVRVYQPYSDILDFGHPMVEGLRRNARQLVEAAILGYGIGNGASPMTIVDRAAFTGAGGHVIGTTGSDRVSLGELPLGAGQIRVIGGALPTPTEEQDHRYGLRDYGLTYSGLFILENAIQHDADALGVGAVAAGDAGAGTPVEGFAPAGVQTGQAAVVAGLLLAIAAVVRRRRVVLLWLLR